MQLVNVLFLMNLFLSVRIRSVISYISNVLCIVSSAESRLYEMTFHLACNPEMNDIQQDKMQRIIQI